MKVEGKITWEDFLTAQKLQSQGFSSMLSLFKLIGLVILAVSIFSIVAGASQSGMAFIGLFFGIALISFDPLIQRRQLRKAFKENQELQAPFVMGFSDESFDFQNEFGSAQRKWTTFTKWKENEDIILLYQSSRIFSPIPKRLLTSDQISFVQDKLNEHGKKEEPFRIRISCIVLAIMLFIVIISFLILNFQANTQNPY